MKAKGKGKESQTKKAQNLQNLGIIFLSLFQSGCQISKLGKLPMTGFEQLTFCVRSDSFANCSLNVRIALDNYQVPYLTGTLFHRQFLS